jgi:hypothetical protein
MNHFTLFAHGESFDVDAYTPTATLVFNSVWHRGDQRRYSCVESKHPTSGIEIVLGDGRTVPLPEQEEIAIGYLKAHTDELRALARFPGVDTFILGLQYHIELDDGIVGFCMGPCALLMWHALNVGVTPTYYVTLDRDSRARVAVNAPPSGPTY